MVVYKYPLHIGPGSIDMPVGAVPLSVQMQGNDPCLWAWVDERADIESRDYIVLGTGHLAPDDVDASQYVGTFQQAGGALIWHLFLKPEA